MATVRYFAAAVEAAGTESETLPGGDLGTVLDAVVARHGEPLETLLRRCSVLHDGQYLRDRSTVLDDAAVVDVLPPFAGG